MNLRQQCCDEVRNGRRAILLDVTRVVNIHVIYALIRSYRTVEHRRGTPREQGTQVNTIEEHRSHVHRSQKNDSVEACLSIKLDPNDQRIQRNDR